MKIIVEDKIDFICPHCKQPIKELLVKKIQLGIGWFKNFKDWPIYACTNCKSILPGPST